ncbi:MAG: putative phage head morphosis protein, partial [Bradyrhizobium sp.]|nr:putative phage head morphosis protein [Bradyrhizobium sp.]
MAKKTDKVLRGVQPNAGIEAAYRAKMQDLIAEMDKSVVYWLRAAYRANEPVMAQDRTPADELRDAIRKPAKRWQRNFDEAAPAIAEYFSQAVAERSSGALMAILKKAGFAV